MTKTNRTVDFRILGEGRTVSNDTYATNLNNNDLIIGSSGSGKTGGYVIPNIISNTQTSMVIADTKSSLSGMLTPYLKSKGYTVKVIDFVNVEKSSPYNPLKYIRFDKRNGKYNQQDIVKIANTLIPINDPRDAFWVDSARGVLCCMIGYVLEAFEEEDKNLWSVMTVYKEICSGYDPEKKNQSVPFLEEWGFEHPESYAYSKYRNFKSVLAAERTWGSICQFITAALDVFEFDEAKNMFVGKNAIKFEEIGKKKTAVFVNISDTDRSLDALANVFYAQLFQALCKTADNNPDGKLEVPVRVFLDDFATNTRIENFDKLISVIRSREISVSIILQSMTQLETIYTHAQAMTIINNCDHVIYLGGSDLNTADYMAARMCKSPESVLTLPTDEVLLLTRGMKGEQIPRVKPYSVNLSCSEEVEAG